MKFAASWGQWQQYGAKARRDAHQLLQWGYADARSAFTADHDETDITGLIAQAIKNRLNTVAPRRFNRYSVADDTPQEGEDRTGRSRRRVDIVVEHTHSRPRLLYIFEAKRLRRGSHPLSEYTGEEGLGRFIRESYAAHALEATMVAFVQSPSLEKWEAELRKAFSEDSPGEFSIVRNLEPLEVVPGITNCWISVHARPGSPDIVICHVLLDCCVPSRPSETRRV